MRPEIVDKMRKHAIDIFNAGLKAVQPQKVINDCCSLQDDILSIFDTKYNLGLFDKIIVIGAGKASAAMAQAVEIILHKRITLGLICVKYGYTKTLKKIELIEAGHPLPDKNGIEASRRILEIVKKANEKTLIICLVSGGCSALLPSPAEGLDLEDKQKTTDLLLKCGATIHEINTIRKHLSSIKGGQLVKAAFPAQMLTLIISDVVGDDLDIIGSGPTVPDSGTFVHCRKILEKYMLLEKLPDAVKKHIEKGIKKQIPETPKPGDKLFDKVSNVILANNFKALKAAKIKAEKLKYNSLILFDSVEGETKEAAKEHVLIAKKILATDNPLKKPACLLSGGETTVTIQGNGKGGRNQEFALQCVLEISGHDYILVLSAGTDGSDGPTDAAGAIVDSITLREAKASGLDSKAYLEQNDSYHFFEKIKSLFKTGPTNTNVMDLRVVLIK